MSIRGIRRALVVRFNRRHLEREIDEEIAFHVERRAAQLRASGVPASGALAEAARRFGDVRAVREECVDLDRAELRREHIRTTLDHLGGDVRFAWRSLRRAPAFTAIALGTLSIAIGIVTAIVSFVYAFYWKPLPYTDAHRIVAVEQRLPRGPVFTWSIAPEAAKAVRDATRSFERVAIFATGTSRVAAPGVGTTVESMSIDTSFVALFALEPQLGRTITSDEIRSRAPVVMISDALWRSAFAGDSSIVGRRIRVNDEIVTVAAVLPPAFRYPRHTDVWQPLVPPTDSNTAFVTLLGKLRRGTSRDAASAELATIAQRLAASDPRSFAGVRLVVEDMLDRQARTAPLFGSLFIGTALLVLLIACSNVANLFLVRGTERRAELAVRSSLGATRARLVAQTTMEAVLIAIMAAAVGAMLSSVFVRTALSLVPTTGFPSWLSFSLDRGILGLTIAIAAVITLFVGVLPSREAMRFDLVGALKMGGDTGSSNTAVLRIARRAIVFQLAGAVVLFVGAALFARSYRELGAVDLGYPAERIAALETFFDARRYPNDSAMMRFAESVADRVRSEPSIRDVAIRGYSNLTALADARAKSGGGVAHDDPRILADGDTTTRRFGARRDVRVFSVSDSYFATLDLRVLRGEVFRAGSSAARTAVVSDELARAYWGNRDALGHTIQFGRNGAPFTVIGVVQSVRDLRRGNGGMMVSPQADLYLSAREALPINPTVLAHARGDLAPVTLALESAARHLDAEVTARTRTMADNVTQWLTVARIFGSLLGTLAITGLVLSMIGIYGVVAYGIAKRTREMGIRIALGGTSGDVLRLALAQASRFVLVGLASGIVLSLGATRLLRMFLFGVSTADPLTYAVVAFVFGGVSLAACYLPARRVTKVDPLIALRAD